MTLLHGCRTSLGLYGSSSYLDSWQHFSPYNSKVELGYGIVVALLFSGYILVDTQLIMRHYHLEEEIAAAISLYLDIINLFLAILRILNSQSNN